mmetsp:Transcript_123/g.189  ORF Transcript_123/g.189 Transcript_123/m.189 type:complete len:122 (-) Transcript_123:286-651(-)|eukprot:CAMPEP_0201865682 /NCGR_PEP_ID=MMETSP0902-20130614/500_1 /ASSEMBLY_ACC=CAM_ASM_000551 /TAXON_ID=420261 /ORGANISM="Thalassiosira antarctica, Strain CCMP982" /LENGTH=121 /DNA_ID=CAMNT_0048390499 /DNA_START=192 /DNA_END=557 /DNA_ORIENTATION=-
MIRSLMVIAVICFFACSANAFQSTSPSSTTRSRSTITASNTRQSSNLQMIFGPKKDDGKPGDYLCKDCGYVFTGGPEAWAKLPDSYGCPPCGSAKFRFKKIPKGSADGKVEVKETKKKSWF